MKPPIIKKIDVSLFIDGGGGGGGGWASKAKSPTKKNCRHPTNGGQQQKPIKNRKISIISSIF